MLLRRTLGKCHQTRNRLCKRLLQQATHGFLSSIIVNLNASCRLELRLVHPHEVDQLSLQLTEYLFLGVDEIRIDAKAIIVEINIADKCQHAIKDASAHFATHRSILIILSDKRRRVEPEHVGVQPQVIIGTVKFAHKPSDVYRLNMQHQCHNTITSGIIGIPKVPRLVHKYA